MSGSRTRKLCGCGNLTAIKEIAPDGTRRYRTNCEPCRIKARKQRKGSCDNCGGTNGLQIDHIDSNRSNNDPSNLQTLCNYCHIIKSRKSGDYIKL